jgi:hypothetical protein
MRSSGDLVKFFTTSAHSESKKHAEELRRSESSESKKHGGDLRKSNESNESKKHGGDLRRSNESNEFKKRNTSLFRKSSADLMKSKSQEEIPNANGGELKKSMSDMLQNSSTSSDLARSRSESMDSVSSDETEDRIDFKIDRITNQLQSLCAAHHDSEILHSFLLVV